ncbi:hypothetical protein EIP86_007016 [Pleurotus ostreatoroseus]|nr:hypothetical protein EIP86_007016 [Pleurotus ostreatoroseus]
MYAHPSRFDWMNLSVSLILSMKKISYKRAAKRKKNSVASDSLVFSLSDLEEDRTPTKILVNKLSKDGRRVLRQDAEINVCTTESDTCPPTDVDGVTDGFIDLANIDITGIRADIHKANKGPADENSRKRRYISSDQLFKNWLPFREEYLDELLRLEGRLQDPSSHCLTCPDGVQRPATYRCDDCHEIADFKDQCDVCIVAYHARSPFHRIKRFNGSYYEKVTLQSLGLVIQLGHKHGDPCLHPIAARSKMVVLHTNGIHPTTIKYCGCDGAGNAGNIRQQLLRYRLFPATDKEPMTCSTFALLETTHLQNVQSKSGVYDLYTALERLTDNAGLNTPRECYKAFSRSVREWKHLKMLKRAGRGHDPSGIAGTQPGDLAVVCPACPHPGINLPEGWEDAPESDRFLYRLCISLDACFRVKRFAVSDETKDPVIDDGLAYFVQERPYKEQIAKYAGQKSMAVCTGLSALDHADSKFHTGYAATGVGACICGRHEFMLPNGVGDLQVGERYVNMDFIWVSALRHHRGVTPFTTYDIMCQWLVYLLQRLAELPPEFRPSRVPTAEELLWGIGKLHWHSHKPVGHSRFSLNFIPGAGRCDGEGIERRWWVIQPITSSTRMMGPGSRQGTLNDQFGYMNWRNLVKLDQTLCKRYRDVHRNAQEQQADFDALTESIDKKTIAEWEDTVKAWERDVNREDPYISTEDGPTEASVKRKLAADEAEAVRAGKKVALHDVSPSAFLSIGLELEEQQRCLQADAPQAESTKIFESRTALSRRISRFREVQAIYTPIVPRVLATDAGQSFRSTATSTSTSKSTPTSTLSSQLSENVCLLLPSDLLRPSAILEKDSPATVSDKRTARTAILAGMAPELVSQETQLRHSQCLDALETVRTLIHMRCGLRQYKRVNVCHQGPNTRAQGLLTNLERRIRNSANKYRAARAALMALAGDPQEWNKQYGKKLLELRPEDIRAPEDDDPDTAHRKKKRKGPAEGRRLVSWIWRGTSDVEGLNESVRIEWLKARGRVQRWNEELRLLPEEVRRSIAFLEWKAGQWDQRALCRQDVDPALQAGLQSYAAKQAAISHGLSARFSTSWKKTKAFTSRADSNNTNVSQHSVPAPASSQTHGQEAAESSSSSGTLSPGLPESASTSATAPREARASSSAAVPSVSGAEHSRLPQRICTTVPPSDSLGDSLSDGVDEEETDDDCDDDEGVYELGEDEAVIAYLELDSIVPSF